jgi:hypothetical protein
MVTSSKVVRVSGIRLACALAAVSFGWGAVAADTGGPVDAKVPPGDSRSPDQPSEPKERQPSSGPVKVKPGAGPGQGDGVESKGPAPTK